MEDTPVSIQSCWNLRAYRHAHSLSQDLFWLSRSFPKEAKASLTSHLRKAASDIPEQITLGWKYRYECTAFKQHLGEAKTACLHMREHLDEAYQRGYLCETMYQTFLQRQGTLHLMLTRLSHDRINLLS